MASMTTSYTSSSTVNTPAMENSVEIRMPQGNDQSRNFVKSASTPVSNRTGKSAGGEPLLSPRLDRVLLLARLLRLQCMPRCRRPIQSLLLMANVKRGSGIRAASDSPRVMTWLLYYLPPPGLLLNVYLAWSPICGPPSVLLQDYRFQGRPLPCGTRLTYWIQFGPL